MNLRLMALRPVVIDTPLVRLCNQLSRHSKYATTSRTGIATDTPFQAHPPTIGAVDPNQIAQLAAKPLHPLTLADLVRYEQTPLTFL